MSEMGGEDIVNFCNDEEFEEEINECEAVPDDLRKIISAKNGEEKRTIVEKNTGKTVPDDLREIITARNGEEEKEVMKKSLEKVQTEDLRQKLGRKQPLNNRKNVNAGVLNKGGNLSWNSKSPHSHLRKVREVGQLNNVVISGKSPPKISKKRFPRNSISFPKPARGKRFAVRMTSKARNIPIWDSNVLQMPSSNCGPDNSRASGNVFSMPTQNAGQFCQSEFYQDNHRLTNTVNPLRPEENPVGFPQKESWCPSTSRPVFNNFPAPTENSEILGRNSLPRFGSHNLNKCTPQNFQIRFNTQEANRRVVEPTQNRFGRSLNSVQCASSVTGFKSTFEPQIFAPKKEVRPQIFAPKKEVRPEEEIVVLYEKSAKPLNQSGSYTSFFT